MKPETIAILGAGSWGSAIAIHLAKCGNQVHLWAHRSDHVTAMQQERCNAQYLPNIPFPKTLIPTDSLQTCLQDSKIIIIAVPSHAFSELLQQLPKSKHGIAWLTKGIDPASNQLLSTLVSKSWGDNYPVAMVSGPSFAKEVAQSLPTALVIAGKPGKYLDLLRSTLHYDNIRVYLTKDLTGVQLAGAVKNVLAIACGISDGLQYGANAKAALITRGLAEMTRLGLALKAKQETFMGLAGVGDLVLTCTDNQSRNRRFGLLLGQGVSLKEAEIQIGQVVEGKNNAAQICHLAAQHHIEMPICSQVNALLQNKITAQQAVNTLMRRPPKAE